MNSSSKSTSSAFPVNRSLEMSVLALEINSFQKYSNPTLAIEHLRTEFSPILKRSGLVQSTYPAKLIMINELYQSLPG